MAPLVINTAIPANVTAATVTAALQNNELMIKVLCPDLVSYKLQSGDPASTAVYHVVDKKPQGESTITLTLTRADTGVDTQVQAKLPVGQLKVAGKWRVVGNALKEEVNIDANIMMKKMIKGNVEKGRPAQHTKLFQLAVAA